MEGQLRLARSLAAAVVATLVGLLFHSGAEGAGSALAVIVSFVLTLWVGAVLAGRRLGLLALTLVVSLAQIALHFTMSVFSAGPVAISGMHGGSGVLFTIGAPSHGAHHHLADSSQSAAMLLAHMCAVVVTVAFLKFGEDMLLALGGLVLGPLVRALITTAATVRTELPHLPVVPELRGVSHAVLDSRFRRGPPIAAVA